MHPDSLLLAALIDAHDHANGNTPDSNSNIAGINTFALTGAAGARAQQMFDDHGSMAASLNPQQKKELVQLMAALWKDGFVVGARSQQSPA